MNLSTEQLAELLAGIARSQQAIIDAIESENAGWRNTHLLPKLTTASNMRTATARLFDVPSRILLRSQGRLPMDVATIARTLDEALSGAVATPKTAAAPLTASPVASAPVAASAASKPGDSASPDLDNFFDS